MRSPAPTGTGTLTEIGSMASLIRVPLAEPGSTACQLPSGCRISSTWRWETPGSSGGPVRSDLNGQAARDAAAADPDLVPGQREGSLRTVRRERHASRVRTAIGDHVVEVLAVGADDRYQGTCAPLAGLARPAGHLPAGGA
jgi:hypothetical protein